MGAPRGSWATAARAARALAATAGCVESRALLERRPGARGAVVAGQRPGGGRLHPGVLPAIQQRRRQQPRQGGPADQGGAQPRSQGRGARLPGAAQGRLQQRWGGLHDVGPGAGQRGGGQLGLGPPALQRRDQRHRRGSPGAHPGGPGGGERRDQALHGRDPRGWRSVPRQGGQGRDVCLRGERGQRRSHRRLQARQARPGRQQGGDRTGRVKLSHGLHRLPPHLRQRDRPAPGTTRPRRWQRAGPAASGGPPAAGPGRARRDRDRRSARGTPAPCGDRPAPASPRGPAGAAAPRAAPRPPPGSRWRRDRPARPAPQRRRRGGIGPRHQPLQRRTGAPSPGAAQHHRRRRCPGIPGRQRRQQLVLQAAGVAGQRFFQLGRQRGPVQQRPSGRCGPAPIRSRPGPVGPGGPADPGAAAPPAGSGRERRRPGAGRPRRRSPAAAARPGLPPAGAAARRPRARPRAARAPPPPPAAPVGRDPPDGPAGTAPPGDLPPGPAAAPPAAAPPGAGSSSRNATRGAVPVGIADQDRQRRQPHPGLAVAQRPQHRRAGGWRTARGAGAGPPGRRRALRPFPSPPSARWW